jgi:hypothetical protein
MKASLLRTAAMLAVAAILAGPTAASAACDPGARIDGTTAGHAKRMIERAGYSQVRVIRKGCDNFWHATAARPGYSGRVVLAPTGEVMPENE